MTTPGYGENGGGWSNGLNVYSLFYNIFPSRGDTHLELRFDKPVAVGTHPDWKKSFAVYSGDFPSFSDDLRSIVSVYEMVKNARANTSINVELVRDSYIVISTDIPDLRGAIIFGSSLYSGRSTYSAFDYMPMQGRFFNQDIFGFASRREPFIWSLRGVSFVTYMPYHLFNDHRLFYLYDFRPGGGLRHNRELSHQIGHYYRIYGDMADFKAFYESLDLYEVLEEDNTLILEGQIYKWGGGAVRDVDRAVPVDGRAVLRFKEENGQRYVAYSFVEKNP
jgi:hypothetical protein